MTAVRLFLLTGARPLVTMNPGREVHETGWVAARDGLILALGAGSPPDEIEGIPARDFERHNADGCVVLPGLINTHHHLYQTRTRAWGPLVDAELFDWLRGLYPVWAKLTDTDFEAGARAAFRELLRSGCTTTPGCPVPGDTRMGDYSGGDRTGR